MGWLPSFGNTKYLEAYCIGREGGREREEGGRGERGRERQERGGRERGERGEGERGREREERGEGREEDRMGDGGRDIHHSLYSPVFTSHTAHMLIDMVALVDIVALIDMVVGFR